MVRTLCTVFCAVSINLPAGVMAVPLEENKGLKRLEEQSRQLEDNSDHTLAYLCGNSCTSQAIAAGGQQTGNLVIYLCTDDGHMVSDAQVVTTVCDGQGLRQMTRAWPFLGGYLVATDKLPGGRYHVEAEIVTDGWLLTDEFDFSNV